MQTYAIDSLAGLWVEGPDAETFLQGLLSSDLSRLSLEQPWGWSACLNRKGKVITTLLMHKTEQRFLLCMHQSMLETILSHLERHRLRAKIALNKAEGIFHANLKPSPIDPGPSLQLWRSPPLFYQEGPSERPPSMPETIERAWTVLLLRSGYFWMHAQESDRYTAHEMGLDALQIAQVDKGCYLGQEVVSRVHYLSKNHPKLYCVEAQDSSPPAGNWVSIPPYSGRMLRTVPTDGGRAFVGLASLRDDRDRSPSEETLQIHNILQLKCLTS